MKNKYAQGDVIKIDGKKNLFLIVSNNTFIRYTGSFHICPLVTDADNGPLHIEVHTSKGFNGKAICEQLLLINPSNKSCSKCDDISYDQIMNISDAVQGIFEND